MHDASDDYGGPSRMLGSDDAGKCLYSIDDNIVRLCCQGVRPCSPFRVVWSVPLQSLWGPKFRLGS